jgi:enoyl-CoA hydratase
VSHCVAPDELLPLARKLASDMQSCDPRTMRGIKRVINEGYNTTLGEGMRLEKEASRKHMESVTPEMVAARRKGIQERGRQQRQQ